MSQEQPSQTGTSLEKTGTKAVTDQRSRKPRGLEDMEREDLIIPRIAIAQSTSKIVTDGELTVGALYNTITHESFRNADNKPCVEFVAIAFGKSRRLWDKDDKNNSVCMSNDAKVSVNGKVCATECPFNAYNWSEGPKHERIAPACTMYYNYLSLIAPFEAELPVSISMGRTSAKAAKNFNSFIVMTNDDLWGRVYALTTEKKENNKGVFFVFKVKAVDKPPQEVFKRAEAMAVKMAGTSYVIHDEDAGAEAGAPGDEPYKDQF